MFGEPQRTQADLNFTLFRIPIRVHPWFWLIGLLLGPHQADPPAILTWMAAFFLGVLCHELGHALLMRNFGYFPWITLYGLGGMASYDRPHGPSGQWADSWRQIFISAAGPLAGFLVAGVTVALVRASGHAVTYVIGAPFGLMVRPLDVIGNMRLTFFVFDLLFVTIVYGILNLLPIYPLDGGHIAREVFLLINPRGGIRQSLWLSVFAAGAIAAYLGVRFLRPLTQNQPLQSLQWTDLWMIAFFGYLAYSSYQTLQIYSSRGRWY
jgi:Zn-dependent protease